MATIFSCRTFSVDVGLHRYPDGRDVEVALVQHAPAVVLIPLTDTGALILVRQYRPSVGRALWELPAGGVGPNESPDAAAIRECAEEARYLPGKVEHLCSLHPAPGFCNELLLFYRLTELRPVAHDADYARDDDESMDVHVVSLAEARAMVARGDIIDLKTAYALTLI